MRFLPKQRGGSQTGVKIDLTNRITKILHFSDYRAMLEMGASKPWPEAMKAITGQDRMDASAFREYFKPLENWLIAKNKELEEPVGWSTG